jgi:protein phosphatase
MSVRVLSAGLTDRGQRRARNEDAYLIAAAVHLDVVADGMGGHRAGDVASALAIDEMRRCLVKESSGAPLGERMAEAVIRADRRIREQAASDATREGMGTTVTALAVDPEEERTVIVHVGDSRAYLLRDGRLSQLTRDHTWVQDQVDAGALTPAEARRHPYSSVLTQAAGVGDEIVPQVLRAAAVPGDVYLLCTDGLTNMLSDVAIERILEDTMHAGLDAAARALVAAANDRGGVDNITAVLLRVESVTPAA